MLPPETDLRYVREYWITEAGSAYLTELAASEELTDVENAELSFLRKFAKSDDGKNALSSAQVRRIPGGGSGGGRKYSSRVRGSTRSDE